MTRTIELQAVSLAEVDSRIRDTSRIRLLPGAVEGVETNYFVQGMAAPHSPTRNPRRGQVFLFTRGAGEVWMDGVAFGFAEVAAFFAPGDASIVIKAISAPLEYLEILIDLQEREVPLLLPRGPYFIRYSHCEAYSEAIKSAKTVSRTIVPANTIPRFCMGSVEALGPDEVTAHSHPMLEQLFLGLPENACVVTADDAEAVLGERALLHIPLGSRHGVRVEGGRRMHYVWMDFFRNEEDLAYIQEQHNPIKR